MKYNLTHFAVLAIVTLFSACSLTKTGQDYDSIEFNPSDKIQTTLDSLLIQRMTELRTHVTYGAVMEVKTGKIVALSNWEIQGDSVQRSYNHMLLDCVDPGSAFMIASYAAMLENGTITPDAVIDTENTMENRSTFDYHGISIRDDHPCGAITADDAMVQSSHIAIAKMVTETYESNPQDYLEAINTLGWFLTPELSIGGDTLQTAKTRSVNDATWSKASLAQISYGYEMQATPLHTLLFFNSIANDGVRPGAGRVCSKSTVELIKHSLEGVVDHGTGSTLWAKDGSIIKEGAKSQLVRIAGKTGIAQIYKDGTYSGNGHYVTFVGYFPADNPQYSCIVTMEAPLGGNYGRPGGGYMAGPVVRKLAESIYQDK